MLSETFLRNKINSACNYWIRNNIMSEWSRYCIKTPTYGFEVRETKSGKLTFIIYNLKGNFNGHYKCIVNINTFEYRIKKIGCFGGFMWIKESDDDTIYTKDALTNEQILEMEAHIANTLCKIYYPAYWNSSISIWDKKFQLKIFGTVEEDF